MKESNSPSRSLRHKPLRQLNLDELCADARYCSTPGEQNVPGKGNSTSNETLTEGGGDASLSPTLPSCDIDEEGNFGTGTQTHQISFLYQVQTTLNQTVTKMEEDVLLVLEKALAQQLLTSVFSNALCSTGNSTVTEARISQDQSDDGATVSGLSSEPRDTVLPGVDGGKHTVLVYRRNDMQKCEFLTSYSILIAVRCRTPLVGDARRCFLVSGAFTVLSSDDSLPLNWTEPYIRVSTKQMMEDGVLNSVHPDVIEVSYFVDFGDGEDVGDLSPTVAPNMVVKTVSEEKKMEPWAWVLISFGIIGVLVALFAIRRRQKRQ